MKDKNQAIHTKEKLLIYKEYLKNYLYVMCHGGFYNIFIWEPFAGVGREDDGSEGSAIIAAELIQEINNKQNKDVRLFLNELDTARYDKLCNNMKPYEFTSVFNVEGSSFLLEVTRVSRSFTSKVHNLFFIDPYGYTQYTQENITQLLQLKNTDYLLFIPTTHIYRFRNKDDNPAKNFVLDLGIKKSLLDKIDDQDKLAEALIKVLKEKAKTRYGYRYELKNRTEKNIFYHLLFLTKNSVGAKKFLEAKNKVKQSIEKKQITLFDADELENMFFSRRGSY